MFLTQNLTRLLALFPTLLSCALVCKSELVINEIMQSNISVVYDDLKDYPDSWVELYNTGDNAVNLSEYSIGIKTKFSKSYLLPEKTVEPGEYVVVYCDKVGNGLHTDFRLESGKDGQVILFHNGEITDKLEGISKQPAPDISFGRETDGGETWGYQLTPTPGSANRGGTATADKLLPEPIFSVDGCVNGSVSSLTLTIPAEAPDGSEIRYSLDCSDINLGSTLYDGSPISLEGNVVVRARLFCPGYLSPIATTHSYLHHYRDMTLPVVSVVSDDKMLYDSDHGILVSPQCYNDYRRPINFELFEEPATAAVINQLCETRTGGGWTSRNRIQKTLMIYANKRFGKKRLDYEFFPDQRPGITDYKSIMLRNAGNDYDHLFLRDAAVHRLAGTNLKGNLDWQAGRLCVLYINGVYSGLRYIRERSNEDNVYTNYDGLEDIDMVENWTELKEGSWDSFIDFKNFYSTEPSQDMSEEYRRRLDVEEFLDVFALNMFYQNIDWPGNNFVLWRPQAEGGRWRAIIKDMDWIMGFSNTSPTEPQIKVLIELGNPASGSEYVVTCMALFRNAMMIDEFRDIFIDHNLVYMSDFMKPGPTIAQMDYYREQIEPEWQQHCIVAGFEADNDKYDSEYEAAKDWLDKRWNYYYSHLSDYFSLGKAYPFELDMSETTDCSFTINGVSISNKSLSGKWPAGRTLSVSTDCAEIVGWKVTEKDENGETINTIETTVRDLSYIMPKQDVYIAPIINYAHNPALTTETKDDAETEYFDLSGRKLYDMPHQPGIYIERTGSSASKFIL